MNFPLRARTVAELLGTAFLLAAVVGSGIMGGQLAGGNVSIALLANTLATGAMLIVLILTLGPVSGAHFNPAVTLEMAVAGILPWREAPVYLAAQFRCIRWSGIGAPDVRNAVALRLNSPPTWCGSMVE
jgi:glycerol uptake facilitator-like aquaporin